LPLDHNFVKEYKIRSNILKTDKENVSIQLHGSKDACIEAFNIVVQYLGIKFPYVYYVKFINNKWIIRNKITNFTCSSDYPFPLEGLALLTGIDFTILQKNEDKYFMTATASLFAIGRVPKHRLNLDLVRLHNNAPNWRKGDTLFNKSTSIFDKVKESNISHRSNIFLVNSTTLYLVENIVKFP